MSGEQRPVRRADANTYFVGRRAFEAPEVFAVTARDVERLGSGRRYGGSGLDWHGGEADRVELSRQLISRVVEQRPSRELQARFALYVLDRLPEGGFVLNADDVWRWLRVASDPDDFAPAHHSRLSWSEKLRAPFRGAAPEGRHA